MCNRMGSGCVRRRADRVLAANLGRSLVFSQPPKETWRSRPSIDHPRYSTSATSRGSTHRTPISTSGLTFRPNFGFSVLMLSIA